MVYRGCANPWNLPLDVDVNKQCEYQGESDWRPLWWFCDGNLCNDEQLGGSDETCGDYSGTLTSEDLLDVIGAKESKTIGASGQGQNQFKTTGATGQVQSQFKTTGASGQGQLFNGQNTDQNIYQITTADGGTTADKGVEVQVYFELLDINCTLTYTRARASERNSHMFQHYAV